MRTKITLFLLFINVALFFFIFAFERKWRTEELAADARSRVLGSEAANLHALEISGQSLADPIRLVRDGDTWSITSPYEWPANPHAVSRIVNELQFLEPDTSFSIANLDATGLSLADYGLDHPTLTVDLAAGSLDDPITTTLAIGNHTEIGQRLYVLSPDATHVHVVPDTLAQSLSLDLSQLRANSCFTIPVFEVRSLNLQNDGPANVRVRLRREGNRWRFESPVVARASTTATEVVLSDIASLRTASFLGAPSRQPDLRATAGVDNPSLRITLEGNNRRETLLLGREVNAPADRRIDGPPPPTAPEAPAGNADTPAPAARPDPEFYAQMEGRDAIFTVVLPARLADDLRRAQSELRDKSVLDLAERNVDAITLADADGHEVILQKVETNESGASDTIGTWQVVQRDADGTLRTQPADTATVEDDLLDALRRLRATSFERDVPTDAELETWGLARPTRTITLSFSPALGATTPPADAVLQLGTDQAGQRVYAQVPPETFVYGVAPTILDHTTVTPLRYRKLLLRELPAGARLTGLTLRDLADDRVIYQHQLGPDETWDDALAPEPADRREALTRLRAELRTLRAQRLTQDHFTDTVTVTGQPQPWRYRLDVDLSVSGDEGELPRQFSLFLAPRDGGDRQLVGAPDLDVVFLASAPLVQAMWTLTYAERDPGPIELTPPPATDES